MKSEHLDLSSELLGLTSRFQKSIINLISELRQNEGLARPNQFDKYSGERYCYIPIWENEIHKVVLRVTSYQHGSRLYDINLVRKDLLYSTDNKYSSTSTCTLILDLSATSQEEDKYTVLPNLYDIVVLGITPDMIDSTTENLVNSLKKYSDDGLEKEISEINRKIAALEDLKRRLIK